MDVRPWGSFERRGEAWEFRWRSPSTGKPCRRKCGTVRELGERLDEGAKERIRAAFRVKVLGERGGPTFGDFLDAYEHYYRLRVKPSTYQTTYRLMRRVAEMLPGPMSAVDATAAESLLVALARHGFKGRPLASNTVRLHSIRLSAFWRAAKRRGVVSGNPWLEILRPERRQREIDAPGPEAVANLVRASPPGLAPVVAFLAETGLRVDEAASLRWEDVQGARVTVRRSKSRIRAVPLSPGAQEALAGLVQPMNRGQVVFPQLRTRGRQSELRRKLQVVCGRLGLPKLRLHDLRHSCAYRCAAAGASAKMIGDLLGITEATARVYMDHHPEEFAARAVALRVAHERRAAAKAE